MAHMLVVVLHDPEQCLNIAQAWEQIGVTGVTLLDSMGSRQLQQQTRRDDLPLVPSMRALFASAEEHNRTLFTVIQDDALLECAIAQAVKIVGDFMQPQTGILFTLPVTHALGVPMAKPKVTAGQAVPA
jgi:nitrogen regulatory protein P-II 1